MIRLNVEVPEVEHAGDLNYAEELIRAAGGQVVSAKADYNRETALFVVEVEEPALERFRTIYHRTAFVGPYESGEMPIPPERTRLAQTAPEHQLGARRGAVSVRDKTGRDVAGELPFEHGPEPLDFLSTYRGSPGFVVDERLARETPCVAVELSKRIAEETGRRRLVFSRGVRGPLDEEQVAGLCPSIEERELSAPQRQILERYAQGAARCSERVEGLPLEERIDPWLACLHRELKARARAAS